MAVYTELTRADAERIARAHGLGEVRAVHGVLAGSVNSNFFVDADRRVFVRIYEEQTDEGLEYERALLAHLAALEVPRRVAGPAMYVAGKPIGVFEVIDGEELCQRIVTEAHAHAVGAFLARAHLAGSSFPIRREGRFTRADVRKRYDAVRALDRPELRDGLIALGRALDEVDAAWDETLPRGVIHGDLFRDNVRWDGARIAGVLDWESASDGLYTYDLAVAILAWCWDDAMRDDLASAMKRGYASVRPLEAREERFLRTALLAAAARFTTTRITDYHLRDGAAQVKKDWRRFLARLTAVMNG